MKLAIAILLVSLIQKFHLTTSGTATKTSQTTNPKHTDVGFTTTAGIHGQSTNKRTNPDTTVPAAHKPVTEQIAPSARIPIPISISIPTTISYSTSPGQDTSFSANISFPANSVFLVYNTSKAFIEFPKNVSFLPRIPFQKGNSSRAKVLFTKNFSFSANISFPKNNLSETNISFTENTILPANIKFAGEGGSLATLLFLTNTVSAVNISLSTKTSTPYIPASTVTTFTERSPKITPSSTVTHSVPKSTSSSEHTTSSTTPFSGRTLSSRSTESPRTLSSARTPFSASITPAISSRGAFGGNITQSCQLSPLFSSIGSALEKVEEKFLDFCQNTKPSPTHINNHDFKCVKTATNGYVYMKTCSSNWNDSTIREYCEGDNPANSSLWLTVPVTKNGTTFKNIFCLVCQNEKPTNWSFWELRFSSINKSIGDIEKILEGRFNGSVLKPNEAGFWTYTRAEKKYFYFLYPEAPKNSQYTRCCEAPSTGKVQNTCFSHDSHVYTDCVIQSNNSSKSQSCKFLPTEMSLTFKVNLLKDEIPQFPHCNKILGNTDRHLIICPSETSSTTSRPSMNSSDISTEKHISDRAKERSLLSTVTSGLLILSSLVIILHLLIFCSLPEKSLWDKCLFVFSIMLLVQSVSVICGTYFFVNALVSKLWHYSILGCSTWILILSYDYRVNLYKTTRIYTGPDTKAHIKFWFYLTISCGIPLLLTSLIFCFAPSEKLPENTQPNWLINSTPITYFWVSAFLLSLASCYLLFLIAFMIFLDHRLRYTRQRLYMPGKIVLMMTATWILVSLWMLSYLNTPNWALHVLHLLQVVLFLIFTFSQIKGRYRTKDEGPEPGRTAKKKDSAGPVNLLQPKVNVEQFTEEHFESITKQITQDDTKPRALHTYTNIDFKF